jgi:plastocyanin
VTRARTPIVLASAAATILATLGLTSLARGRTEAGASAATLRISADSSGGLKFSRRTLSAPHGRVTIVMRNPRGSGLPHSVAIAIAGPDRKGHVVQPGGTSRATATLRRGRYTYYCTYDSHRSLGMRGTLTVR